MYFDVPCLPMSLSLSSVRNLKGYPPIANLFKTCSCGKISFINFTHSGKKDENIRVGCKEISIHDFAISPTGCSIMKIYMKYSAVPQCSHPWKSVKGEYEICVKTNLSENMTGVLVILIIFVV